MAIKAQHSGPARALIHRQTPQVYNQAHYRKAPPRQWGCLFSVKVTANDFHSTGVRHRLVAEVVEPLADVREKQERAFCRYRQTPLSPERADHAILDLFRTGVLNVQRIPEVLHEWATPSFEELEEAGPTAWRLFNAVTFVLNGRILAEPQSTQGLHRVIDGVC